MIQIVDGPAGGVTFTLHRAPIFLRLVHGPKGWDALDQLEDTPASDETVHVYRKAAGGGIVCIHGRGGGCFPTGEYFHVPDADGEAIRETSAWRARCDKRAEAEGIPA